ncbi:hypothetical protein D3C81_1289640 [compost metagenome]
MQVNRQRPFAVAVEQFTLAGNQCRQGAVGIGAAHRTHTLPVALAGQQQGTAPGLGDHKQEVILGQLRIEAVERCHQVRLYRDQAQAQVVGQGAQAQQQFVRYRGGNPRLPGGFGREAESPGLRREAEDLFKADTGIGLQLVAAVDLVAPRHPAETVVVAREQHAELGATAHLLGQQPFQGFGRHGPGGKVVADEADTAQPLAMAAAFAAQADTGWPQYGDITLTPRM